MLHFRVAGKIRYGYSYNLGDKVSTLPFLLFCVLELIQLTANELG